MNAGRRRYPGGASDCRGQIGQVGHFDRCIDLQCFGAVDDAQHRLRADQLRRADQFAHAHIRGDHASLVGQGDVCAAERELGQAQRGPSTLERGFGDGPGLCRQSRLGLRNRVLRGFYLERVPGRIDPHEGLVCRESSPVGELRRYPGHAASHLGHHRDAVRECDLTGQFHGHRLIGHDRVECADRGRP